MTNWFEIVPAVTEIKYNFDNGWYYAAGKGIGYLTMLLLGRPDEKIDYSNSKLVVWILSTEDEVRETMTQKIKEAREALHENIV